MSDFPVRGQQQLRSQDGHLLARGAAVLAAISLHALVLAPVLRGVRGAAADGWGYAATGVGGSAGRSSLAWVNLDEPRRAPGAAAGATDLLRLAALQPPHADVAIPAELEAALNVDLSTVEGGADATAQGGAQASAEPADSPPAYVRHMGELTSRIQGAWTLPGRGPKSDFHCRVRIRQGQGGAVEEVEFQRCDADAVLRASLLHAIRGAAPLPRMGDSALTGSGVTLDFVAFAAPAGGRRMAVEPGAAP